MTIKDKESKASAPTGYDFNASTEAILVSADLVADAYVVESNASAPFAQATTIEAGGMPTTHSTGAPPRQLESQQSIAVPTGAPVIRAPQTNGAAPRGRRNQRVGCCNNPSCCCITSIVFLVIFICCALPAIIVITAITIGANNVGKIIDGYSDDTVWNIETDPFDDIVWTDRFDDKVLNMETDLFDDKVRNVVNNDSYGY